VTDDALRMAPSRSLRLPLVCLALSALLHVLAFVVLLPVEGQCTRGLIGADRHGCFALADSSDRRVDHRPLQLSIAPPPVLLPKTQSASTVTPTPAESRLRVARAEPKRAFAPAVSEPARPDVAPSDGALVIEPPADEPVALAPSEPVTKSHAAASASRREARIGTIEQYRVALLLQARRVQGPFTALQEAGRAQVRLEFARDGALLASRVTESSGSALLDDEAVRRLRAAHDLVPVPTTLARHAFAIDAVVSFERD
jgi:outer membrane biosynthesis protein TonB